MRKITIVCFICMTLFITGLAAADAINTYKGYPIVKLIVDGKEIIGQDVPAFQIDGRTMVPLRLLGEALDANVEWNQASQSVIITRKIQQTIEAPKKELITIQDISLNSYSSNRTEISGRVKNNNKDTVKIRFTINFYDPRELLGHVHVTIDSIDKGSFQDFYATTKDSVHTYTKIEVIIDELDWN